MSIQFIDVYHFVTSFLHWNELVQLQSLCKAVQNMTPELVFEMCLSQEHIDKLHISLCELFKRYYRLRLIQYEDVNFQQCESVAENSVRALQNCMFLKKIRFMNCILVSQELQNEMMTYLSNLPVLSQIVYTGENAAIESVLSSIYKSINKQTEFLELKKISFKGCKFSNQSGFYLQKITLNLPSLKSLVLNGLGIGREIEVFNQAIQQIPYLKKLNLGFNGLEADGARILSEILAQSARRIENLNIGSNWLGAAGISGMCPVFIHQPNIKILNLSRNRLSVQGARVLATCISNCRNLESLNLKDNQIREGINELMPAIATLPNLQKLNLSFNLLRSEGGNAIGANISSCSSLITLILTSNDLQEGFSRIAERFSSSCLKTVIAKSNKLTDSCLYSLMDSLPNSSIQKLVLDMNAFTYIHLTKFLKFIHSTTSVDLRLKLPGNLTDDERTAWKNELQLLGYR